MRRTTILTTGLLASMMLATAAAAQSPSPGVSPPPDEASLSTPAPVGEEVGMRITSTAFEPEDDIPERYTCDGDDVSPPLVIDGVPPDTVSLVLIMDDPDAPAGTWDHWVAYDIPPTTTDIPEAVEALGTAGTNSWDDTGYGGPCPPSGIHRYFFAAYAVDKTLGWEPGADKGAVLEAIHDHLLDEATLLGFYTRE